MPILTEISVNRTRATLLFDDRTQLTVRKSDLAACPAQVGDEVAAGGAELRVEAVRENGVEEISVRRADRAPVEAEGEDQ